MNYKLFLILLLVTLSYCSPQHEMENLQLLFSLLTEEKLLNQIMVFYWQAKKYQREIDVSHLPGGIYLVQVTTGEKTVTKKIVISK